MAKNRAKYFFSFFCLSFGLFIITGSSFAATNEGPFYTCAGIACGSDASCYEGECMCSPGLLNCDGNWENGCECGGLYVGCDGDQCGCQVGFNDCDGNPNNGCETGGDCPPCRPLQTRTCDTTDICGGVQVCSRDGYWGACIRITPQTCSPYSSTKCTPTVDGKKCSAIGGLSKCNSCGSKYGACAPVTEAVCCPGVETNCVFGQCAGVKSCAQDGSGWSSCASEDAICCSQDADCDDFNGCTADKCISNKCEYSPLEDCRSLTPVKCKTDNNCASKDSCVDGSCLPLSCNQDFVVEDHKCVCSGKECGAGCYFTDGVCCGDFWNEEFDSCSFDFGYYEERVNLSLDRDAAQLLGVAEELSSKGDLRKASVLAKIAIAIAETKLSSQSEAVKNQSMSFINEARVLLAGGNYSLSLDKVDEALGLLEGRNIQTKAVEEPSLWQKNKAPIIAFSSIIVIILIFIFYVIITPKL